jgi:carbon-monoxide dehydrogenase medium subunit
MLRPFAFYRPTTLPELGDLLAEHGNDAALYAGGTELLLLLKEGLLSVRCLLDVKRVQGLNEIVSDDGTVTIGATVRHRAVEQSPLLRERCPVLAGVAAHVANVRVRHMGTIGGNLAFADPHSDLATICLGFDGAVSLWSRAGKRQVPLGDFILAPYETARREDEIVTSVRLCPWPRGTVGAYLKFGVYERPTLGVALAVTMSSAGQVSEARLAVGCVGPRPLRLPDVEQEMIGATAEDLGDAAKRLADAAAEVVETLADLHGSADYKREMTRVFVRRAVATVAARAAGRDLHERYPHTVVV